MGSGEVVARTFDVVGQQSLSYLQRVKPESATLTIFLHGLGLDAYDYLDYMKSHDDHCVAITLHGFDRTRKDPSEPARLADHARLISSLIARLRDESPTKKLILVGFSLGADLILRLSEYWSERPDHASHLGAAVLLDPNVNHSTMTISSIFAKADPTRLGAAAKELVALLPDDTDTVTTVCEYIGKIGTKDFNHIRQMSHDAVQYWDEVGYTQIGERLARVTKFADAVRVILSAPYESHVREMEASVGRFQLQQVSIEVLAGKDHFDLIDSDVLTTQLCALH